jgi:hypothetical protein
MPPVITGSMSEPSGLARKMCDALVTNGGLPGRWYVCSANAPLHQ